MEHKINEVITYNHEGETIYLKVTPTKDSTCQGCFFYGHYGICSSIRNIIGTCNKIDRTDNTLVIFKQINNKIMKKTIDIYTVMQTSEKDRDLCYNFTSFKEANKQSSDIYKKDVLGKWINVDDIDPIKITDLKPGDYVILRVQYDSVKFDYKLAYVDCITNGKVIFNIQNVNILRTPIKITDFCILPSYNSNNFYKTNK